jgi:ABC transporter substrate binding protein
LIGGRNVRMHLRWGAGDANRMRALAQELVGLQPDIIMTSSTVATDALQRETQTIPIVGVNVGDLVATGLVAAFNRPGGNITGFVNYEAGWEASGLSCSRIFSNQVVRLQFGRHSPGQGAKPPRQASKCGQPGPAPAGCP